MFRSRAGKVANPFRDPTLTAVVGLWMWAVGLVGAALFLVLAVRRG